MMIYFFTIRKHTHFIPHTCLQLYHFFVHIYFFNFVRIINTASYIFSATRFPFFCLLRNLLKWKSGNDGIPMKWNETKWHIHLKSYALANVQSLIATQPVGLAVWLACSLHQTTPNHHSSFGARSCVSGPFRKCATTTTKKCVVWPIAR